MHILTLTADCRFKDIIAGIEGSDFPDNWRLLIDAALVNQQVLSAHHAFYSLPVHSDESTIENWFAIFAHTLARVLTLDLSIGSRLKLWCRRFAGG